MKYIDSIFSFFCFKIFLHLKLHRVTFTVFGFSSFSVRQGTQTAIQLSMGWTAGARKGAVMRQWWYSCRGNSSEFGFLVDLGQVVGWGTSTEPPRQQRGSWRRAPAHPLPSWSRDGIGWPNAATVGVVRLWAGPETQSGAEPWGWHWQRQEGAKSVGNNVGRRRHRNILREQRRTRWRRLRRC